MKINLLRRLSAMGLGGLVVALALTTGCEWTGGGGVSQFNDRYNFLNFSGLYRGINGGLLVTDFSSEQQPPVVFDEPSSTNNTDSETIAHGNGLSTAFSGFLDHEHVVPASISITAPPGYAFTDGDGDGNLTGNAGSFGTINYNTGQWSLDFNGVAIANGAPIKASYLYEVAGDSGNEGSGSGPLGNASSGASKINIFSFNVHQAGNTLEITDNNGSVYKGNFGDVRSAGGVDQDNNTAFFPQAGDEFIAQFEASGISAAGFRVNMVGNFQAIVQAGPTAGTGPGTARAVVLDQRKMFGTWIEENGRTGNINGQSSPITVTVNSGNSTN